MHIYFSNKKGCYPHSMLLSLITQLSCFSDDQCLCFGGDGGFCPVLSSEFSWGTGDSYMETKMSASLLIKLISELGFRSVAK